MMNRFHWSMLIFGVVAFTWWSFFANIKKTSHDTDVYSEEHFLEDVSRIYCDIGSAALKRGDFSKAIRSYHETIAMCPTWLEGYDRLGITYELNNQPDEAIKVYAHAMTINPDFLDFRLHVGGKQPVRTLIAHPSNGVEWSGQDLKDKKIFVYAEKGFAETIIFCRFLTHLKEKAAKVYFKPQEALLPLIRGAGLGVALCNNQTNLVELDVDYYISLLSLQHYLNLPREQLNSHHAYLKSNGEKASLMRKTLFSGNDIKVGIAWQPSTIKPATKDFSIPLSLFAPLGTVPGVKIYLLQRDSNATRLPDAKFINISDELKDFVDTAAAIENLDMLITSDATLAALAGALNKKTWFLTPMHNDWCWLGYWDKKHTVWFDHFSKIQQAPNKNWQPTMYLVAEKLQRFVAKRKKSIIA